MQDGTPPDKPSPLSAVDSLLESITRPMLRGLPLDLN